MISRRLFFHALSQRKTAAELNEDIAVSGYLKNYVRTEAYVLYARFLGSQLKMTNGYDVFSTGVGQMIWDGSPLIPGSSLRDDYNKGRADLTWTNLQRPNCFSPPESMLVGGFMVTLDANTPPEESAAFRRNVVGRLNICGRTAKEIPMAMVATVTDGDLTDIVTETYDDKGRRNDGTPAARITHNYVPSDPPINIESLMQFGFVLESPHPWDVPEDLAGYVFLDGIIFRGVL